MNTRTLGLLLMLVALMLPLAGCERNGDAGHNDAMAQTPDEAMAAIAELRNAFVQAIGQGDAAAAAATYTADAKIYGADGSMGDGTEAIQGVYQGLLDAGFTTVEITPTETVVMGHTAWELGQFRYTGQTAEGEAMTSEGEYVALLEHEDGAWKLARTVGFQTRQAPDMPMDDEAM